MASEQLAISEVLVEWAAAWSDHDVARVVSLVTDDCVYEDVTLGVINRGKEQLLAFGRGFLAGVPDLKIELTEHFATRDRAGMEWTMSGTHTGDLPGMPATGRAFSLRGSTICELRDGRIQRNSDYWDMATFMKQLGVVASG
jgi:steroid delta-isomerase-like uncharacterized protein